MRQSTLVISSLTIVGVAGAAIVDAAAQEAPVPVAYHTDPGPAHPRYAMNAQVAPKIVGQAAITIPTAATTVATSSAVKTATPYAQDPIYGISTRQTIAVEAGDTVYALARRFNVTPSEIISANGLTAPYALKIGQRVAIPQPQKTQTTVAQAPTPKAQPVSYTAQEKLDGIYTVKPGDTLYSLSRQFDMDLATLATTNGLSAPYSLSVNQRLVIPASVDAYQPATKLTQPVVRTAPLTVTPAAPAVPVGVPTPLIDAEPILVSKTPESRFAWPLRGAIVMSYGMTAQGVKNDGINIAAPVGAPVRAAADGEVVYTGSELEGYGNLLLVRHDDGWVSAYAHTDTILVPKGARVKQGQVVAKVGDTGNVEQPQLHFELRHELTPQDPIAALNGSLVNAAAKVR
ncbi:MAG: peptidoglycan DD-metalloendopeptidase family protein [Pseudomonadota bacterium]